MYINTYMYMCIALHCYYTYYVDVSPLPCKSKIFFLFECPHFTIILNYDLLIVALSCVDEAYTH